MRDMSDTLKSTPENPVEFDRNGNPVPERVTIAYFAKLEGVGYHAIVQRIRRGKIKQGQDGLIDVKQARASWARLGSANKVKGGKTITAKRGRPPKKRDSSTDSTWNSDELQEEPDATSDDTTDTDIEESEHDDTNQHDDDTDTESSSASQKAESLPETDSTKVNGSGSAHGTGPFKSSKSPTHKSPKSGKASVKAPYSPSPAIEDSTDLSSLAEAQRQKEWEIVRKERLKNDIAEGKVIDLERARSLWAVAFQTLRERLTGLPDKLAQTLAAIDDPKDIRIRLATEIREALATLPEQIHSRAEKNDTEIAA